MPVAAWRHFVDHEWDPERLADATLAHWKTFDWDSIKLNPRATYFAEAWGNRYDPGSYTGVLPRLVEAPLHTGRGLEWIRPVNATCGVFGEQLELLRRVRSGAADTLVLQTVFSPLSVLAFLAARPGDQIAELGLGSDFAHVRRLIDPILTVFMRRSTPSPPRLRSTLPRHSTPGPTVFFAIVRLAREGVLTPEHVERFVLPYDRRVLEAASEASFNLLHVCGPGIYFDQLAELPAHAISWASTDRGNPSVSQAHARSPRALVSGVDEAGALVSGTAAEVEHEALAAITSGGPRFLLSPGCGIDPSAPAANLHALRRAAEASQALAGRWCVPTKRSDGSRDDQRPVRPDGQRPGDRQYLRADCRRAGPDFRGCRLDQLRARLGLHGRRVRRLALCRARGITVMDRAADRCRRLRAAGGDYRTLRPARVGLQSPHRAAARYDRHRPDPGPARAIDLRPVSAGVPEFAAEPAHSNRRRQHRRAGSGDCSYQPGRRRGTVGVFALQPAWLGGARNGPGSRRGTADGRGRETG